MNLEYNPGSPSDLFGKKARILVVQMTYPELLGFLLQHRDTPAEAEEDLRDIGKRICTKLLEVWTPKSRTVVGLIKELFKVVWNGKMNHEIIERDSNSKRPLTVLFHDRDCKICKGTEEEVADYSTVPYCSAVSGFIEVLLNHAAKRKNMKLPYRSVSVKTISSRISGYDDCIHRCEFSY